MSENLHALTIARQYLDSYEELEHDVFQLQEIYPYHDWATVTTQMKFYLDLSEFWFGIADILSKRRNGEANY